MKKLYFTPEVVVEDNFNFLSLCQTSSSEVGIEDMNETEMDITF